MKRNRKSNVPGIEVEVMLDLPRRPAAEELKPNPAARTPRVTRLMALAVKYQGMVDTGELRDYADIARLGYRVTQARYFQVRDDFPRLIRAGAPAGVLDVTYIIDLGACGVYESPLP